MKEDKELLWEFRENPSEAVRETMEFYGGAIKKICSEYLAGYAQEDVEETVADCFVALWKNIGHFDPERNVSLKSYFYGIARIQALNKKRILAKRVEHFPALNEKEEEALGALRAFEETEQMVEDKLRAEMLYDMIKHLLPPDDQIFLLRYYEHLPEREIAEKLKMTVKAIENRIARGKKKLKQQLLENGISVLG